MKGIPASPGFAVGPAVVLVIRERRPVKRMIGENEIPYEWNKFQAALDQARLELSELVRRLEEGGNAEQASIMEGQLYLIDDPEIVQGVSDRIQNERVSADFAVYETFGEVVKTLALIEDEYIRERIADLQDVKNRLLEQITGETDKAAALLTRPSILLAHDITPSMTAQLNKELVMGFVTEVGSRTSHTSIMARTFGIPAVVGCGEFLAGWSDGETVIVDGETGEVFQNPSEQQLAEYAKKQEAYARSKEELQAFKDIPAETIDGKRFGMYGNIGTPAEAAAVLESGGEGIGLFRSEFLFMDRAAMPSEEEQYAAYRAVLETMSGKPVIVRTLDVGGDKEIPYLPIGSEFNPFLGWRAIRYCLSDTALFKVQLRALLRASAHGDLRIMFPMISGEQEILDAKRLLDEARSELEAEGIAAAAGMPIGIMIEVPSAALVSDRLARHVDFFSIGTNDLIQYTLAADRMNEKVSYLYDSQHLAVLRLIRMVCENARKFNVHVGMCGEMAGDPQLVEILIGLGVEEFSMSAEQIPLVKKSVRSLSEEAARIRMTQTLE
ncbi:phosphoenolpyruvate-protein phosphotransferase [Paenibacillus darwinianus]|uniref:Phosphoenolpyruvate-protein phosphotransferase n=1 Tax=Paenibacillus darwinianus TaxID=1380763 RepID=A0A9W5S335_9BACL|nr:phosphoenolpyruvate-protein phosphotransferase [Paenibacillus darwinianus]EXX90657.1 phosphoenolpyruvate-protein phosphotransferase [Paenibacillus darwinianus]EXX91629.1 phosphoenolpyruvate-protein phosphotransferase [Paenibacillus darwinianus]